MGADVGTGVSTVVGWGRRPSDVVSELMGVLADEAGVVVCDLTGIAAAKSTVATMFAPVSDYLRCWPGIVVVVVVPDPSVRAALVAVAPDRLLVRGSWETAMAEVGGLLPELLRSRLWCAPRPTAPRDARAFTTRTLLDWRMSPLVGPGALVVSELVTNAFLHAVTVVELALSCAGTRVRMAVRDHGGGRPEWLPGDRPEESLTGRGLHLVNALTRGWGVFPSRQPGKTVWAVLDGRSADVAGLETDARAPADVRVRRG